LENGLGCHLRLVPLVLCTIFLAMEFVHVFWKKKLLRKIQQNFEVEHLLFDSLKK